MQHITIAPGLLEQLAQPSSGPEIQSFFDTGAVASVAAGADLSFINDKSAFRMAFTRDLHGASEEKLSNVSFHVETFESWMTDLYRRSTCSAICRIS